MRPKSESEIEAMRTGGKMLARVLDKISKAVEPGINTKELADVAAAEIKALGGRPSFLGHENFPDVMCVSLNNEIVHGLPKKGKIIREGDVVGLDFGVIYKGLITDSAVTFFAGDNPPADIKRLLEGTKRALDAGIDAVRGEGTKIGDISAAVQEVLDAHKLGIIRDLVGHGVGDSVHEPPNIPNYGVAGVGTTLSAGMTICIEPMASLGDWQLQTAKDGFTVEIKDGSIGAHFEHTVLVTDKGSEILTTL